MASRKQSGPKIEVFIGSRGKVIYAFDFSGTDVANIEFTSSEQLRAGNSAYHALRTIAGCNRNAGVQRFRAPLSNILPEDFRAVFRKRLGVQKIPKTAYDQLNVALADTELHGRNALMQLGCLTVADTCQFTIRQLFLAIGVGADTVVELYQRFEAVKLFPWGIQTPDAIERGYSEASRGCRKRRSRSNRAK